jgi:hypothetical protein
MRIHISNNKEYTRIFHKRTRLYNFVYSINSLKFPSLRVGNYQMSTGLLYKLHKQPGNSLYFAFLERTSTFAPSFSRALGACDRFLHRVIWFMQSIKQVLCFTTIIHNLHQLILCAKWSRSVQSNYTNFEHHNHFTITTFHYSIQYLIQQSAQSITHNHLSFLMSLLHIRASIRPSSGRL